MISLIIAGIFFLLSIVLLFLAYDVNKQTYKSGYYAALIFTSMFIASCLIMVFKNNQQFPTSQYYVEKTIKTEIVNNVIVKNDTLIRIKHNDKIK
jgi:sensor histidine kinase regulating citrate/malate metabolism